MQPDTYFPKSKMLPSLQSWMHGQNVITLLGLGMAASLGMAIATQRWPLALAIAALPIVLVWPVQASLGVFAFLIPFDSISALGQKTTGTSLNFIVGAAAGLILLGIGFATGRLARPPRAALWWGLFLLWSSATGLWALAPREVWFRLPTAFGLLLLYIAAASFRVSRRELLAVTLMVMLGATTAAVYAATHQHQIGNEPRSTLAMGDRETNPNQFAASLLMPIALALGGFLAARNRIHKTTMLIIFALLGLGLLIAMSRGSLVAATVIVLFLMHRSNISLRLGLPFVVLFLLLFFMPEWFFSRMGESLSSRGSGRFDIWLVGWQVLKRHGLFGVGLNNFQEAYSQYAGYASTFRGYTRAAHNVYLEIWAETGLVGLSLFLAAIATQMRNGYHALISAKGAMGPLMAATFAGCLGLLANGLVSNLTWRKSFWLAWILLALATRITERENTVMQGTP